MDTIPQLPRELVVNILLRLPVKYLIQLKCVCKPWKSLISDPHFAKQQLSQSKNNRLNCDRLLFVTVPLGSAGCEVFESHDHELDHVNHHEYPGVMKKIPGFEKELPDVDIGGSCNGLICVAFDEKGIFLWNPTIREALELPNIGHFDPLDIIFGLGYDYCVDDYKLLRGRCYPGDGNYNFEVLALKSNIWRNLEVEKCNLDYYFRELPGIFLRGALHWLAHSPCNYNSKNTPVILSFDMVEEKFSKLVELPDSIACTKTVDLILTNSGDSLFLFSSHYRGRDLEAWRLNEYGVKSSWTKIFSKYGCTIPIFRRWGSVLHYTKTGKLILFDYEDRFLVCYDPEDDSWKRVTVQNNLEYFQHGFYVESLVLPDWYRPTNA